MKSPDAKVPVFSRVSSFDWFVVPESHDAYLEFVKRLGVVLPFA